MSRQVNTATSSGSASAATDTFASRLNSRLSDTTSEAFAHRIGVSMRTVQRWRAGETEPKTSDLMRLVQALGCSPSDLLPVPSQEEEAA